MGLLGGFKGKLFAKQKKEKKTGGAGVVCVKFHTFSEFDSDPSGIASTSDGNIGNYNVVREPKRPTKPEVKNVFKQSTPNGDIGKSSADVAKPTTAVPPASKPEEPKKAQSKLKTPEASKKVKAPEKPKKVKAPEEPKKAKAPQEPKKTKAPEEPKKAKAPEQLFEKVKPATKTPEASKKQNSAKKAPEGPSKKSAVKTPKATAPPTPKNPHQIKNNQPSAVVAANTIQFPLQPSDSEDDGNFKIHFSESANHQFEYPSDDDSFGEDNRPNPTAMNYSKAASIFFGEEEDIVVQRPRKIMVDDGDNVSEGSSASA